MDETSLVERLTKTEERAKSNSHRIEQLEENQIAINDLATSTKLIAQRLEAVDTTVTKLANKVDAIEAEPGKRWKAVVEKITMLLIASVVGFMLAKIGM